MSIQTTTGISLELLEQLKSAGESAARGIRDTKAMGEALASLHRRREEIRKKHGLLDIAVPAIREIRQ